MNSISYKDWLSQQRFRLVTKEHGEIFSGNASSFVTVDNVSWIGGLYTAYIDNKPVQRDGTILRFSEYRFSEMSEEGLDKSRTAW